MNSQDKVKCDTCNNEFEAIFAEYSQGHRCAATVTEDGKLYGHYGSTVVDMECHQIVNRPEHVRDGTICDDCIIALRDGGHLEFLEGNIW